MLAGDADRERAVGVLKDAFTEGRLTQGEYEQRVGRAYQARTYAELDLLTADIPQPMAPVPAVPPSFLPYGPPPPRGTNNTAVASMVCGILGTMTGVTAVPAVILGHMAKRQIRESGQDGDGMATAGLVLGYTVLAIGIAFLALIVAVIAATAGSGG
jgi:hypothetical protein